jgi:hypothetical protein
MKAVMDAVVGAENVMLLSIVSNVTFTNAV